MNKGDQSFHLMQKIFLKLQKRLLNIKASLSTQKPFSIILKALNRFFNESSAEEMEDQVRWLSDWEKRDD